jgi:hypothetical protein
MAICDSRKLNEKKKKPKYGLLHLSIELNRSITFRVNYERLGLTFNKNDTKKVQH